MNAFTRACRRVAFAATLFLVAALATFADGPLRADELGVHPGIPGGGLTLFPITLAGRRALQADFILLDEGLAAGTVVITEIGGPSDEPVQQQERRENVAQVSREARQAEESGQAQVQQAEVQQVQRLQNTQVQQIQQLAGGGAQVNRLSLENKSARPLLLMAGEMIRGAKQDRIIAHDVVVSPATKIDDLDVFCVESGRWTFESKEFRSAQAVSGAQVRSTAQLEKSQRAVWDKVSQYNAAVGASSGTQSLNAAYDKPEVKAKMAASQGRLEEELARIPELCGVVVAIGSDIVVADIFTAPELFRRLLPKLLAGYLLDALSAAPADAPPPSEAQVRRYLAAALAAARTEDWRGGDLVVERFESSGARGTRSSFRGEDLHLNSY